MAKKIRRDAERVRKPPKPAGGPPKKIPEAVPAASGAPPTRDERPRPATASAARSDGNGDERAARAPRTNGTRKREVAAKEPPSLVLPVFAYVAFLVVCYVVGLYKWLPATVVYPAFAAGTFAIFGYASIVFRRDFLRSRLGTRLVAAWLALTLLAFALPLAAAIFMGAPIAEGRVTPGGNEVSFDARAGHRYMAFLVGGFTQLDKLIEEGQASADGKVAKQKHYDIEGNWTLALRDPAGAETEKFDGRFKAAGERRRLSKRGVGFHESRSMTERLVFRASRDGGYALKKSFLDAEISGVQVQVYPWYGHGRAALHFVLAVLAMAAGALLDFLLKAKKVAGWFGLFTFGSGILTGYANYYLSEATPVTPVGTFVFSLLVGGVIGLVFATGILYGAEYALKRLNRTYKLSL